MSKSIAAVLRDAATVPTPQDPEYLLSWLDADGDAYDFALGLRGWHSFYALGGMNNNERRMFLLFCSYAAEDEQ